MKINPCKNCGVCARCFEKRWAGLSAEERRQDLISTQEDLARKAGFTVASEKVPAPPPDLGAKIRETRSAPTQSVPDRIREVLTPVPVK